MSKIIIIPSKEEQIYNLVNKVDGFIIGVKNLSTNLPVYFTMEKTIEIIKFLKENNKDIFICLNKNIHNNELDKLKEILTILNNYPIKAVLYYDIALVNLKQELNLVYDLVWSQEHLTTNYETINYWHNQGINYTLVSPEITLDEIIEIRKNTKVKLIVPIFGYLSMFTSKRLLVDNYLKHFNINDNSYINYIDKEEKTYPIITDNNGTNIYSSFILNGIKESIVLRKNKIDYLLVNTFLLTDEEIIRVLDSLKNINKTNELEIEKQLDILFKDRYDKGFLYKETIYKVKNNE